MLGSISHHVGLEQAPFQKNLVQVEFSENSAQNLLSDFLAIFGRVRSVGKDFGLNNGNETVLLANEGVFGKASGIGSDGLIRGASSGCVDLEDSSPFGESAAELIELSCHGRQLFKALSPVFFLSVVKDTQSFVDLDAGDNAQACNMLGEVNSVFGGLLGSFFVEDDARNVFFNARAEEEHFSVPPSVLFIVLKAERFELLFD